LINQLRRANIFQTYILKILIIETGDKHRLIALDMVDGNVM